jgi:adenylate cyclase
MEVVTLLNKIFTAFDELLIELQIEKIKTIGDAYMAVSGAPIPRGDHVDVMCLFALRMLDALNEFNAQQKENEPNFGLRIGINCGSLVAGVVGTKKYLYDVWGSSCNLASRMESTGVDRRIQVSHFVYEAAKGNPKFRFVERGKRKMTFSSFLFERICEGEVFCKGIGNVKTYFLESSASEPHV